MAALSQKGLISDEDVGQILSQAHTGFGVWLGDVVEDSESERFIARYIERGPVSLEKLSIQDDIVTYTTNDGVAHEFDGLEFLALLSTHVAKPCESLTRYYGWYSCRARGERRKQAREAGRAAEAENVEPGGKASLSWAACMKRIFELDPLECPKCKNTMRIIAFVQDSGEIKKIMQSLKIPDFKPPAAIPRAPPQEDFPSDFEECL